MKPQQESSDDIPQAGKVDHWAGTRQGQYRKHKVDNRILLTHTEETANVRSSL